MNTYVKLNDFDGIFNFGKYKVYMTANKELAHIYSGPYSFLRKKEELALPEQRLLQSKVFFLLLMKLGLYFDCDETLYASYQEDVLFEGFLIDMESLINKLYRDYQKEKQQKEVCDMEAVFDYAAFTDGDRRFFYLDDEEVNITFERHENNQNILVLNIFANNEYLTKHIPLLSMKAAALTEKTCYFIALLHINYYRQTLASIEKDFPIETSFLIQQADKLQQSISI